MVTALTSDRVRSSVQRLLDSMTGTAAFVRNGRLDILSANQLARGRTRPLHDPPVDHRSRPRETVSFLVCAVRRCWFEWR
jgi:hypothetical protein